MLQRVLGIAFLTIMPIAGCDAAGVPISPTATPTLMPTSTTQPTEPTAIPQPPTWTRIPATETASPTIPDTAIPVPTHTALATDTPAAVLPTETPTTEPPTAIPVPPTETPVLPTPVPPVTSGGLGLTRAEWEQIHGKANTVRASSVYEPIPFRGRGSEWVYTLYFWNGGAGYSLDATVEYISYNVPEPKGITMAQARERARQFIPNDAKLLRTGGDTWVTEIYHSEWLAGRYVAWSGTSDGGLRGTEPFYGEPPGTFSVDYFDTSNMVNAMHFRLGTPERRK